MFNNFSDLNSDPDYHCHQEDDELYESDDGDEALNRKLNSGIRKIKRAAFESCISEIEVDDECILVKTVWGRILSFVRKPYVREAIIITALMLFKTGLFITYRAAHKHGLEIVSL